MLSGMIVAVLSMPVVVWCIMVLSSEWHYSNPTVSLPNCFCQVIRLNEGARGLCGHNSPRVSCTLT